MTPSAPPEIQRVMFYVDGFNFYYGLRDKNWKKYYWLDMVKFCEQFVRKHQSLVAVNYFSAPAITVDKNQNQSLFFSANKDNQRFLLHLGKYIKKKVKCNSCKAKYQVPEEKQTDVNIATTMIGDVVKNKCDISIVISADSDLIPPLHLIREISPDHKIFVAFPPKRFSSELNNIADAKIFLDGHEQKFKESLLTNPFTLTNGVVLAKPAKWV